MKSFLHLLLLLLSSSVFAQQRNSEKAMRLIDFNNPASVRLHVKEFTNISSTTYKALNENEPVVFRLFSQKIPLNDVSPFLTYFCTWDEMNNDEQNTTIRLRFSEDNIAWTEWTTLKPDEHLKETTNRFIGELQYVDQKFQYYQAEVMSNKTKKGMLLINLYFNFFNPGKGTGNPSVQTITNSPTACNAPLPSFVNRVGWGCSQVWSPSTTAVTHLIVHHAAGTNTSSDWGAVVLAIWNYHTTPTGSGGAGYSDIAYNWLVAPNGVLYEGRYNSSTANIQGAHFCGTNGNTMGVCMLGTYTSQTITAAARTTLVQVLGWKACERTIDPLASSFHANSGLTLNNISGHRDGCVTECPGNAFYPDFTRHTH